MGLGTTDRLRKHLLNSRGRRLNRRYVVFESDDWGSERIPSKESLKKLENLGADINNNPFSRLDSLETGDDLTALFEVLRSFKDINGNNPVITANIVTANPDYNKIRASGFTEYYFESTENTYLGKKDCHDSLRLIKEGISEALFKPQLHGREHLNVSQWLTALQSGNRIVREAFNLGIYGIDLKQESMHRNNYMAAFYTLSDVEIEKAGGVVNQAADMFEAAYGFRSRSFIAPCYIWHPFLELYIANAGIEFLQGLPVQYVPVDGKQYRKIFHFQGQRNENHQFYFIRNCFFEPSIHPKFNYIEDCLRRMEIIYFWGKPAIIGTHRINFMGSLLEENRTENLRQFRELIGAILKKWPDVEFISTDKLGELYKSNQ